MAEPPVRPPGITLLVHGVFLAIALTIACQSETPRLAQGAIAVYEEPIESLADLGQLPRVGIFYSHLTLLYSAAAHSLEEVVVFSADADPHELERRRASGWRYLVESPPVEVSLARLARELTAFVDYLRNSEITRHVDRMLGNGDGARPVAIKVRIDSSLDPAIAYADRDSHEIVLSAGFLRALAIDTCDRLVNDNNVVVPRQDSPLFWMVLVDAMPVMLSAYDIPRELERFIVLSLNAQGKFFVVVRRICQQHPEVWQAMIRSALDAREFPGVDGVVGMLQKAAEETDDVSLRRDIDEIIHLFESVPDMDIDDWGSAISLAMRVREIGKIQRYSVEAETWYLRSLLFVLAHEASHLWFDQGEGLSLENEANADVFGELVSFVVTYGDMIPLGVRSMSLQSLYNLYNKEQLQTDWPVTDADELGAATANRIRRDVGFESDRALYLPPPERVQRSARTLVHVLHVVWPLIDWTSLMDNWK